MAEDRIEVLVYRDPDEGDEVRVFVNGQTVTVHEFVVDPGAGHQLSAWQADKRAVLAVATPAAGAVLAGWYDHGAGSSYVEDDRPWVTECDWVRGQEWAWSVQRSNKGVAYGSRRVVVQGLTEAEAEAYVGRLVAMADTLGISWEQG